MRTSTSSIQRARAPMHRKQASASFLPKGNSLPRSHTHTMPLALFLYAFVFLVGYLPGILLGRNSSGTLGDQLSAYYLDDASFSGWPKVFSGQMAACFLQLTCIWLCGFCVFGMVLLFVLFAAKGLFLGFCASACLTFGGASGFGRYWLVSCLPNVLFLFVCLWLAGYAFPLSRGLFQSVFLGGAPRGQLAGNGRRLTIRYLVCLALSGLISALYSGLVLLVLKIL